MYIFSIFRLILNDETEIITEEFQNVKDYGEFEVINEDQGFEEVFLVYMGEVPEPYKNKTIIRLKTKDTWPVIDFLKEKNTELIVITVSDVGEGTHIRRQTDIDTIVFMGSAEDFKS